MFLLISQTWQLHLHQIVFGFTSTLQYHILIHIYHLYKTIIPYIYTDNFVLPPPFLSPAFQERVDAHLQAFGLRVGAGALGWANLFEPFQACPLPFIALELAYAVGWWNGTDGNFDALKTLGGSTCVPPSSSHHQDFCIFGR